jgi:hypothetical protein
MDDLKLPVGDIPQDKPGGLPMDEYFKFVLFCRKAFPLQGKECRSFPAPVRFVIRDEGETWPAKDPKKGHKP